MYSKLTIPVLVVLMFISCSKEVNHTDTLNCTQTIEHSLVHSKSEAFQNHINSYIAKGLPGISMLIEDSSGIFIGSGGYADIEKSIKFSPCHVSMAASITKLTVGTLTLMLQDEGKLSIEDPVSDYISDEILSKINNASGITIRQLMNHSTGIYDVITDAGFYLAVLNNPNKQWTQEELLSFVYGKEGYALDKYPSYYSNTNTLLLSMCIEKATGKKHHELLREKIFVPLGMNDTYLRGRETLPNITAQGYFDLHNNGTIVNVSNLNTGSGNGYGGLFSTVYDLRKFIRALFIDKTLISESGLLAMNTFLQEDEDFFCGAGTIKKFTQKATYAIGHTGRDLGYSANLFYFPERNSIMIFFVNYGTNGESALRPVFRQFESELADIMLE